MKKICLLSIALLCYTISFGTTVSIDSAKIIGVNYLSQHGVFANKDDLQLTYTSKSGNGALNYFYVFSTENSFVIVSADDWVKPVIGYSKEGPFQPNMPKHILSWFSGYEKQIDYVINNNVIASSEVVAEWNDLKTSVKTSHSTAKTTSVSPLLATTWDQNPNAINPVGYYNDDCPYDATAGTECVTGCVATATAQVMKFWNWPITGTGSNSYTTSSYGTLYADFGATTYDWASMPNSLSAHNPAVARLMSDVGISVNMQYTADESGAYVIESASPITNCAEYALKTYFNYDATLSGKQRSDYSDATWITMLESNLDAGEPIIYSGEGTGGGHCFVFDGYTTGDMFHVNWGWSGYDNGYFTIDALNPGSVGTGGGSGGYNSEQTAILGIKPIDTTTSPTVNLALYDYVNLTASTIGYGGAFTVSTNIFNYGTTNFSGDFCAAAFDASGTFVTYINSVTGTSLPAGDIFSSDLSFPTSGLFSMLPGIYTVGVFYRPTGGDWVAVSDNSPYTNFPTITVTNSAPIELYSAMTPTPTIFVEGSAASVNLNIYNSGATDFSGSYDVSLYNLDGTFACEIQNMTGMALPAGDEYLSPYLTFTTSNVTAAPGTYLLALTYNDGTSSSDYLAGADYFQNPIYVTVVAPPLSPDIYEVNNTAATAYTLPLSFVSNVATSGTPGSNFHIVTDQDYYKIVLPAGYTYTVTARVNDDASSDDAVTYTTDAIWSYSTDGGTTWSSVYDATMPGTINVGATGGTVIFHCSPHYAGNTGTYLLKIPNITRLSTSTVPQLNDADVKVFPIPTSEILTIDLTGTNAHATAITITDATGRKVSETTFGNQTLIHIPVTGLSAGIYIAEITTDEGVVVRKITVSKK